MSQQKANGLVSSPIFSISWWCCRTSCSSEAQKQWHTLWNHALLMLMKMRIITNNPTGPQSEMWMSFWTTIRKRVGYSEINEGDLNVSIQVKKVQMPLLCNTDFPHFPRRGFCRSCQHSAQWSCKWYCLRCCLTALPIICCAMQVFIISVSPINQSILFCCFSMHKSILFFLETR